MSDKPKPCTTCKHYYRHKGMPHGKCSLCRGIIATLDGNDGVYYGGKVDETTWCGEWEPKEAK